MSVTVKNPVIQEKIKRALKLTVTPGLKIIRSELIKESRTHGWLRFGKAIEYSAESKTKGIVFVNDEVSGGISKGISAGNNLSTATNSQVGAYLHYGTRDHGPVNAKAMRWYSGSKIIFAKRVKGIPATPWWGLTEAIKEDVREHYQTVNFRG